MMRLQNGFLALVLFGSGFSGLVFQTVWLREFRLIFGCSTPASAAVLGVFMAGLGFGAYIFGRKADRWDNPLRLYAALELGVAGFVAVTPFLLLYSRDFYLFLGGESALGTFGATLVRLMLTVGVLGIPVLLMAAQFQQ